MHGGTAPTTDDFFILEPTPRLLRAKAAAWDFIAAQGTIPETTLDDYRDAALAYAHDETGIWLGDSPRGN